MSAKVLILTAGYGEGHNAAARALAAACDAQQGAGTAKIVDAFALASPRLNNLTRRSYLGMINRAPGLWRRAYAWLDRSPLAPRLMRSLVLERRALARELAAEQPALLCSTYPVYGFLLDALAQAGRRLPPHVNVVTDSISINSLWWRASCDAWFLPNEDSALVLRQAGVAASRLHVLGFPVSLRFAEEAARHAPPDPAAGRVRVLYIVNSGTNGAAETARRLLRETDWEVTCTVGRNERLRRELDELVRHRARPARILGWTDEIPTLLATHHVVVSKAGGATTQEALAARCPMIVNQIVPGQEEGNYELLRRHGIGALAETPEAVIATLRQAFAGGGAMWRQWCRALAPLSRPRAASDIATHVLARIEPSEVMWRAGPPREDGAKPAVVRA